MAQTVQSRIESEIADALARFHREQQGHSPADVRAYLLDDMVIVRSAQVFTPNENTLAQTSEGRKIIQSARRDLRALTRREIEAEVTRIVSVPVLRSFYDLDVRTADQVEIYILAERPLLTDGQV